MFVNLSVYQYIQFKQFTDVTQKRLDFRFQQNISGSAAFLLMKI